MDVLPADDRDRVVTRREQRGDPLAVQAVAFVLELAQLDQLALRVLEALELGDGVAQLPRRQLDQGRLPAGVLADLRHAVAEDVPGCLVDVVADVVESTCEAIHVVAVERRHEGAVEEIDHVVRQPVALVLRVLDLARERVAIVREVVEQTHEEPRDVHEVRRRPVVQVVELPPLRDERDAWHARASMTVRRGTCSALRVPGRRARAQRPPRRRPG